MDEPICLITVLIKKNRLNTQIMRTVSLLCAILLFISILPVYSWFPWLPAWYLQLWTSFVCAGTLWLAYKDYKYKNLAVWNLGLVMMAIFYNPIFPIQLESSYISGAIALLCILFLCVFAFKRNS